MIATDTASHDSAVKDASPRLSYYASKLPEKDTWFQTPEGYRIYKNVPIARTGAQNYLGRELKKNPGYDPSWNIGDDEMVTVYRPEEEVLAPESIASGEGKSVLDEHPPDPQVLVDALDEYEGSSKGHAQNVRVGERLSSGEIGPVADLFVKHPDLNMKIDGGVRDVSCGYTFRLGKDADGRFIQTKIRLNHVAIVPKGRAGSEVGIKDAAPDLKRRMTIMSNRLFRALGFQAAIKDAKPEEVAAAIDALSEEDEKEKTEREKAARDKAAKDRRAGKDADAHPKDCRCDAAGCKDARGAKDDDTLGDDGMTDSEREEKEKKEAEEKAAKDAAEADALILPSDEHARSEFSTGDAAKHLAALKPLVAKSKDKGAKDSYSALHKGLAEVSGAIKDGAPDPFAALAHISPGGGVNDNEPEIPMFQFFNGRSHAEGVKAYNDYQIQRAQAARR